MMFENDKAYIASLTGKKRVSDQIEWLRVNGYVFEVNRKGPVLFMQDGKPAKHQFPKPPKGLLDQGEIIRRAVPVKPLCGVYFLITGSRIIYVGKSMRVMDRITEHVRAGKIAFDAFSFIPVPKTRLLAVEAAYIAAFKPPANIAGR